MNITWRGVTQLTRLPRCGLCVCRCSTRRPRYCGAPPFWRSRASSFSLSPVASSTTSSIFPRKQRLRTCVFVAQGASCNPPTSSTSPIEKPPIISRPEAAVVVVIRSVPPALPAPPPPVVVVVVVVVVLAPPPPSAAPPPPSVPPEQGIRPRRAPHQDKG